MNLVAAIVGPWERGLILGIVLVPVAAALVVVAMVKTFFGAKVMAERRKGLEKF